MELKFVAEAIRDHRDNGKGAYQFLVKWEDFEESSNTWETESSLECPNLIHHYMASKGLLSVPLEAKDKCIPNFQTHEPRSIVGVTRKIMDKSVIYYQIRWKDSNIATYELSSLVRERCPQLLLDFYQESIEIVPPNTNG